MYTLKRIYLPENAPKQAFYAANELRYYISMMCGSPCHIQSETDEDAVTLEQIIKFSSRHDATQKIPHCTVQKSIRFGKKIRDLPRTLS